MADALLCSQVAPPTNTRAVPINPREAILSYHDSMAHATLPLFSTIRWFLLLGFILQLIAIGRKHFISVHRITLFRTCIPPCLTFCVPDYTAMVCVLPFCAINILSLNHRGDSSQLTVRQTQTAQIPMSKNQSLLALLCQKL
jgi:hypothetical protein